MPAKFSTENIKKVGEDHYGEERRKIRTVACEHLDIIQPRILELYGSGGNMTQHYLRERPDCEITGVDKAPGSTYQMDNEKFVERVLPTLPFFDLLDFDAYGSPNPLIWKAVTSISMHDLKKYPRQFIVVTTDGLGLAMKQNPNINWTKYFLILDKSEVPDLRRPWEHHIKMTDDFFQKLGRMFDWKVTCLDAIQGKGKNFVFAAYKFER